MNNMKNMPKPYFENVTSTKYLMSFRIKFPVQRSHMMARYFGSKGTMHIEETGVILLLW